VSGEQVTCSALRVFAVRTWEKLAAAAKFQRTAMALTYVNNEGDRCLLSRLSAKQETVSI
jgi:hypothetical protein